MSSALLFVLEKGGETQGEAEGAAVGVMRALVWRGGLGHSVPAMPAMHVMLPVLCG